MYIKSDIYYLLRFFVVTKMKHKMKRFETESFFFVLLSLLAVFNVVYIVSASDITSMRRRRKKKIIKRKQKIHSENFSFLNLFRCVVRVTLVNFLEVVFWHFSDSLNVMESSVCECYVLDADRKPIGKLSFVQGVKKKNVLLSASTLISLHSLSISISILSLGLFLTMPKYIISREVPTLFFSFNFSFSLRFESLWLLIL